MAKQESMYFAPRCLFCNRNNRRRHTRKGATWTCTHCGERNPGPGMLKAIVGRFTLPPANGKPHAPAAAPAAPVAVATTIKGVPTATPTPPQPAPVKRAAAPPASVKAKAPTPPTKKPAGWIERVVYGS